MFKAPKQPKVEEAPPTPVAPDAAAAAADQMERERKRRGFGAAIIQEGGAVGLGEGKLGAANKLMAGGAPV